jgi:hypothetical protein
MSFHHSPRIVTDGLVLCLDAASKKSYSGGGTIWRDLTQNANNFSLVNGTSFSNSNQGSFLLDGNDDVISISNPINIPNTESSSSADIWFNTYTTSGTKQILFVGKDGNSYQIEIRSNILRMGVWGGGFLVSSNITPSTFTWYNCTISTNGTTHNIYLNGQLINSNSTATQTGNVTRIVIGSYILNGGNEQFNGLISNVKIYNRVLLASEISQNYNALKGRFGL